MKQQLKSPRFKVCEGAGQLPLRRFHQVGICRDCGVRTFLDDNDFVQPHKASRDDRQQFINDRRVMESRIRPLWLTSSPLPIKKSAKKSA